VTTAILGGEAEVPTIDGRVRITIEPGTQSGKVVRLRGKGLPDINGHGRGDIIVVVDVVIPTTLTKEERKLVEELSEQPNFKRAESHDKQDVLSRMKNFFR
jgi:molecular chaperone DnaJ